MRPSEMAERRGGAEPLGEAPGAGYGHHVAPPTEAAAARPDPGSLNRQEITRLFLLIRDAYFAFRSVLEGEYANMSLAADERARESLARRCHERGKPAPTARQYEVALLLMHGLSSKEIVQKLYITRDTLNDHFRELLRRTGFADRRELRGWLMCIQEGYGCPTQHVGGQNPAQTGETWSDREGRL